MKNIFVIGLVALSFKLAAQNTLSKGKVSGFGGLFTEVCSLEKEYKAGKGFSGAALFNRRFYVGIYFLDYGKYHEVLENGYVVDVERTTSGLDQTGIHWGYFFIPERTIHPSVSMQVGYGKFKGTFGNPPEVKKYETLLFSPKVELNANLFKWCKLSVGVGYRFCKGSNFFIENGYQNVLGTASLNFGFVKRK